MNISKEISAKIKNLISQIKNISNKMYIHATTNENIEIVEYFVNLEPDIYMACIKDNKILDWHVIIS